MLLNTPLCDFGWQAPGFTLSDPAGRVHRFEDLITPGGLLVAFICNHCPYVQAIASRLATDTRELQDASIGVAAIMSNDYKSYPSDSPENMSRFAEENGFDFPYLVDEDQSVGRAWGAICTPDFFGLNGQGQLQYRGRLDDAAMGDATKRRRELVDAMLAIATTGHGPKVQTASMGCSIKWADGSA
ncbi:MAG: thioredoxin family protein [Pseudomonadota bacterium]